MNLKMSFWICLKPPTLFSAVSEKISAVSEKIRVNFNSTLTTSAENFGKIGWISATFNITSLALSNL